jgi:carboxypeptidase Taq
MLLEKRMFAGDLGVKDLPDAWNELYQRYLGISPKDYKDGVMQDVHWYNGIIAYFPTYALGNLYSAMMLESAERALPTLWKDVEAGHLLPLLGWLRTNVHELGMTYRGPDLIRKITGKNLDESAFLNYLRRKFKVT